jgi:transcriptional regulator with XRE-family HTH domain
MVPAVVIDALTMDFAHRLTTARKERGLTQQTLADRVGVHVTQIRRYEAGTNTPNLDVLRNIAVALSVSIDSLAFDDHDRDPDEDLRLVFEASRNLEPDEREVLRHLIEAMLLKHEARRWTSAAS